MHLLSNLSTEGFHPKFVMIRSFLCNGLHVVYITLEQIFKSSPVENWKDERFQSYIQAIEPQAYLVDIVPVLGRPAPINTNSSLDDLLILEIFKLNS